MAKFTDRDQKALVKGVRMAIEESSRNLERVAGNINRNFERITPPLRLDKLPEYQTALDAIKKYSEAVISEMNRRYREDK